MGYCRKLRLTAKIAQIEYDKILHHDCFFFLELCELRLILIAANYV